MHMRMMRFRMGGLAGCHVAGLVGVGERATAQEPELGIVRWRPAYLDARQAWWMDWPSAALVRGTLCASCHTTTSYALARTALRTGAQGTMPAAAIAT